MKLFHYATIALVAAAMAACSGAKSETDNVTADTVAEGNTEITITSEGTDSTAVSGSEAAADAVIVFDNDSKTEPQGKPLVIDFSATWCGPCQQFKPTFHKVAEQYAGKADFATADVDVCSTLAQKYQIQSIPYVMIIKTDGSTAHVEGKMSETEFTKFLNDNGIN